MVLFLSAFVVLFLTGLSQMRLAGNVEEYKKEITVHENSIKDFNISLNSVEKENETLKKQIETIQNENNSLKEMAAGENNPEALSQKLEREKASFDNLIMAEALYKKGKKVSCAQMIKDVFPEDLGKEAKKKYVYYKNNSFPAAVKYFYSKARGLYINKEYAKAQVDFQEALYFDDAKYYTENTLYYLAAIGKKINDVKSFNHYSSRLLKEYPKSGYNESLKKIK